MDKSRDGNRDTYRTRRGRTFTIVGDPGLLTLDRLASVRDRLDEDPRIATVSVVPGTQAPGFLRATSPTGCAIVIAEDAMALVGPVGDDIGAWSLLASEHGLWHDWLVDSGQDVAHAPTLVPLATMDAWESGEPSSSHYGVSPQPARPAAAPTTMSLVVDITWLGAEQTGAQVLTTAALGALIRSGQVDRLTLMGRTSLPAYAAHLAESTIVEFAETPHSPADIVWYPNQIDQRSSIARARDWGRRVVTTYLDLIAYDIPRYHATAESWAAYRSMQRKIALSVDGITTISADVADRLCAEVPRLDRRRVRPIPLGLDHLSSEMVPELPDDADGPKAARLASSGRPFLLVLGNDFRHKNRDFAIRVWRAVVESGEDCDLVLAGLHVKGRSSREAERTALGEGRGGQATCTVLGHVSERTRAWLLANAAVVLYPSSAEGFGFIPYEAAALGTPATFTSFGPLAEISGIRDVPSSWTVGAYANDVLTLLREESARKARVDQLGDAITRHSWDSFAADLLDLFREIAELPQAVDSAAGSSATDAAALAAVLSSRTWRATEPLRTAGSRLRRLMGR